MKSFAKKLKNYFDTKGFSMPFIVKAAERISYEEEVHLTIIVMAELLKEPEELVRECVQSCVADTDSIELLKIERVITEYARMN